jgi:hypothetical protein
MGSEGDPMTDKPDGKRWNWGSSAWIVVSLLAVYVLSMGPVWWASDHFELWGGSGLSSGPQFAFYAPLFWLGQACPLFGKALIWYVHLWADIAG